MMTKIVLPILISAALAMPTSAQETGQAQAFQVARLGDNQMSCEALVGEINA